MVKGKMKKKTKKNICSPDVKMIPAIFFFSFQVFSERISCNPNPDSCLENPRSGGRISAGYLADIRDVTDVICKLRKTYN